ncbi:MAG: hypothetical protein ACK56I_19055, partial [bacterium]
FYCAVGPYLSLLFCCAVGPYLSLTFYCAVGPYLSLLFCCAVGPSATAGAGQQHEADGPQRSVRPGPGSLLEDPLHAQSYQKQPQHRGKIINNLD